MTKNEISFTAHDLRIVSEMNARCHWAVRARRFRAQKAAMSYAWTKLKVRSFARGRVVALLMESPQIAITLTRVAPRRLDSDNCASGLKACRDYVAKFVLGIDDGDTRLTWIYEQRKGPYAVEVKITAKDGD